MVDVAKLKYSVSVVGDDGTQYNIKNYIEALGWEEANKEISMRLTFKARNDTTSKGQLSSVVKLGSLIVVTASDGDILAKTQNIGSPGSGEHDHKTFVLNSVHGPVKGTIGTTASGQPDPPDPPQSSAGGGGSEGAHQHHVLVPEKMRSLKPGDRVLVAWVQNEAVVIDIVVSS